MNNLISNFDQILDFAGNLNVPVSRKRGVIREYLHSKFISMLYSLPKSEKLSFVGGTSFRLLRDLNRFSEDLDFDNLGLTDFEIAELVQEIVKRFVSEGIDLELTVHNKEGKTYFDLKFPNLLIDLKISTNPREKLMIKFDYSSNWKAQKTELILFSKYGFIQNVVTNSLGQFLVQKLVAYSGRNITQPRDIYDIVWLYSKGAKLDLEFATSNNYPNLANDALKRFKLEGVSDGFKNKFRPFLFNPDDVSSLDLFGEVLAKLNN